MASVNVAASCLFLSKLCLFYLIVQRYFTAMRLWLMNYQISKEVIIILYSMLLQRKWRETKLQLPWLPGWSLLGCVLLHFPCSILRSVAVIWYIFRWVHISIPHDCKKLLSQCCTNITSGCKKLWCCGVNHVSLREAVSSSTIIIQISDITICQGSDWIGLDGGGNLCFNRYCSYCHYSQNCQ